MKKYGRWIIGLATTIPVAWIVIGGIDMFFIPEIKADKPEKISVSGNIIITNCKTDSMVVETPSKPINTGITIPQRYLTKDFLLGKVDQRNDSAFIEISEEHTPYNLRLLRETYSAFIKMYEAAKRDGVELKIISAARTYNDQCLHWDGKWKKLKNEGKFNSDLEKTQYLLRYCALPGISRHHWGTEIDMNSLKLAYFETPIGKKMYKWLLKNANSFGFYQPYTPRSAQNREKGFYEEKWHWSYRPLSGPFLAKYKELVTEEDITGFTGDNTVKNLNLDEWINSINPELITE